jgi:hypothetical protein
MVVHASGLSYVRDGDWGLSLRPSRQKVRDPISTNKLGVVVHTCVPSYLGGGGRRIAVWSWHWANSRNPF